MTKENYEMISEINVLEELLKFTPLIDCSLRPFFLVLLYIYCVFRFPIMEGRSSDYEINCGR